MRLMESGNARGKNPSQVSIQLTRHKNVNQSSEARTYNKEK